MLSRPVPVSRPAEGGLRVRGTGCMGKSGAEARVGGRGGSGEGVVEGARMWRRERVAVRHQHPHLGLLRPLEPATAQHRFEGAAATRALLQYSRAGRRTEPHRGRCWWCRDGGRAALYHGIDDGRPARGCGPKLNDGNGPGEGTRRARMSRLSL